MLVVCLCSRGGDPSGGMDGGAGATLDELGPAEREELLKYVAAFERIQQLTGAVPTFNLARRALAFFLHRAG